MCNGNAGKSRRFVVPEPLLCGTVASIGPVRAGYGGLGLGRDVQARKKMEWRR